MLSSEMWATRPSSLLSVVQTNRAILNERECLPIQVMDVFRGASLRWAGGTPAPTRTSLAAPARTPAAPAPIAASIARHDGSAEAAGGGVAQVDESGESVGGVDGPGPWPLVVDRWPSSRAGHLVCA